MSAPEQIWAWPKGSWFTAGASDHPVKAAGAIDQPYVRADLYDAAIAERDALRTQLATARADALREAAEVYRAGSCPVDGWDFFHGAHEAILALIDTPPAS